MPRKFLEAEAFVRIQRVADLHSQQLTALLKAYSLTPAQYNVLRILRGAREGLACGQIAERMITHDPDVTRLVDRLESGGLAARGREASDRRVITVHITEKALGMLRELDDPIRQLHLRQFGAWSRERLRTLIALLEECR